MPLSVLQQRQQNVVVADLCSTMDLVAVVTSEQILSIYRTITWERVLSKNCNEFNFDRVTAIKFSPDGKYIAVGFVNLNHVILTLETNEVFISLSAKGLTPAKNVIDLWWLNRTDADHNLQQLVPLLHEISDKDNNGANNGTTTISQPPSLMICRQHDNTELIFFAFGIYPIAKLQANEPLHDLYLHQVGPKHCLLNDNKNDDSMIVVASVSSGDPSSSSPSSSSSAALSSQSHNANHCDVFSFQPSLQIVLKKLGRLANIQMLLSQYSKRIDDHINNLSKKWKECIKTIPMKLSLLKSLIEGYQLNMSTIEFLHTVAVCGMWHPAASTSFSQHWNEQGITRLRSGIDATSRLIIRTLQLKVAPLATNICLLAKLQQEAVMDIADLESFGGIKLCESWHTGVYCLESAKHLVFAVDDAVLEAKRAREAFLVFLQFLKDGLLETSTNNISDQGLFVRKQCAKLFQGKRKRLDFSNPEHVTGTFLCNHLQKLTGPMIEFTAQKPSEIKHLITELNTQSNLFNQKPLYEQSKAFRDCYDKSIDKTCPTLVPSTVNFGQGIVREAIYHHSIVNAMKLSITLDGTDENIVITDSTISSYLLKTKTSKKGTETIEVIVEMSDLCRNARYYCRVQLPCQGSIITGKTIVYNRKGTDPNSSECAILAIIEQENGVYLYRIPLAEQSFVSSEELLNSGDVPSNAFEGLQEHYSCDNLSLVEANASRGVLFLCDKKGKIIIVDLENEEEEDASDEADSNSEGSDECG